jgi:hypothetical protein
VTTTDTPGAGVAAEGGRLLADSLTSALVDLVEALRAEPDAGSAPHAAPPPPGPGRHRDGVGRSLASLSSRAVADAASAVAASLVPAIVERIDVNALLAKVDVDALVARIDLGRILDTIDVDEVVQRIDMAALAREALEGIDVGDLIQESTASIGADTVEAARVQAMNADEFVAGIVDRLLGRRRPRETGLRPPRR